MQSIFILSNIIITPLTSFLHHQLFTKTFYWIMRLYFCLVISSSFDERKSFLLPLNIEKRSLSPIVYQSVLK